MTKKLPDYADLAGRLVLWFGSAARDLPWRKTRDPYAIWVSEVMLQQTQVRTVIPYWERWLRELPTIAALAAAPTDRILKLWEGLGYYSRARNLQRAAQMIVREYSGIFPTDPAAALALPGIGPYTAGAVASIAFNQPEPILDGNVIRVLTRLLALGGDPRGRELNRQLWAHARSFVEAAAKLPPASRRGQSGHCSVLNQSLMELGATICTPTNPDCAQCPLQKGCLAHRLQRVDQFPETAPRPTLTVRRFATAVLEHKSRFLICQRPVGTVNAGFWEFPNVELTPGEDPQTALAAILGLPAHQLKADGEIRHSITRYRMIQRVYRAKVAKPAPWPGGRWVGHAELAALPVTAAHRKWVRKFGPAH